MIGLAKQSAISATMHMWSYLEIKAERRLEGQIIAAP